MVFFPHFVSSRTALSTVQFPSWSLKKCNIAERFEQFESKFRHLNANLSIYKWSFTPRDAMCSITEVMQAPLTPVTCSSEQVLSTLLLLPKSTILNLLQSSTNSSSAVLCQIHYFPEYCTSQFWVHLPNLEKSWENERGESNITCFRAHGVTQKLQYATKTTQSLKNCLYWIEEKPQIILEQARGFDYTAFTRLHEYWCPDLWFFVKQKPTSLL